MKIMSYFENEHLKKSPPPTKRAAYSDRTAWLMACMSALAYKKFEKSTNITGQIVKIVSEAMSEPTSLDESISDTSSVEKKYLTHLAERLDKVSLEMPESSGSGQQLKVELGMVDYETKQLFSKNDTQAFLAVNSKAKIAVLAFRGTEATSFKDIKTDIKATAHQEGSIRTHSGFREAYNHVADDIKTELTQINDYTLYITGHSLGGALAILATRDLEKEFPNCAACYTYGSPRVGNDSLYEPVKTPIYRIVNRADMVPNMPPGIIVDISTWVLENIPYFKGIAKFINNKFGGYRHGGDQRYLTNTKKKGFSDVKLHNNVAGLKRLIRILGIKLSFNNLFGDHSIDLYCKKLAAYALKRNPRQ